MIAVRLPSSEPLFTIGIDPGLDGAIAVIPRGNDAESGVKDMPSITIKKKTKGQKREYDKAAIVDLLRPFTMDGRTAHVFMEKVHAMPGQGVVAMFSMGKGVGILEGIIAALRLPVTFVDPREWKSVMLKGKPGKDKNASIVRAKEIFPSAPLDRKKDHGRAEALLIAYHGCHR